ncbi:MAG: hypothetical protein ACTS7I_03200, partial [Candidatus Hodgkinia cicadicola]
GKFWIVAVEMVLQTNWKERITNDQILRDIDKKRTIIEIIHKRKANWIGHIVRQYTKRNNLGEDWGKERKKKKKNWDVGRAEERPRIL